MPQPSLCEPTRDPQGSPNNRLLRPTLITDQPPLLLDYLLDTRPRSLRARFLPDLAMSWFVRGVQSAVFHYASCAPCTGYMYKKQRQKEAKEARKARTKLQEEHPDLYHHPEPTGTNPYWQEEIVMGPGPPPRRNRKTCTNTTRATTTTTRGQGSLTSQGGSSIDINPPDKVRLSDDTMDDDNWNRKLYQREDEELWGFSDLNVPLQSTASGTSLGGLGLARPSTSRSGSYYASRTSPAHNPGPVVVSLPSPRPLDHQWMLQPPPRASVMSGKERATLRSRSGSGASSRVELNLQRQASAKKLRQRHDQGGTPEMPSLPSDPHTGVRPGQRHERSKSPQIRPHSAASYRSRTRRRRDTAMTKTSTTENSSGESTDTVLRSPSPKHSTVSSLRMVRVRTSRQQLSTVLSSGSGELRTLKAETQHASSRDTENISSSPKCRALRYSTQSTDSDPYLMKHRRPLASSDLSSLNVLQDLVSPGALLNSRFVSAPLMEARIKLPPSDLDEQKTLDADPWLGSGFAVSRDWDTDQVGHEVRVPFDSLGAPERDPRMRWSVDF